MGRKKKKELKPWCWYCNREFDEEKVLIYHQKAKHFKCHICGKKLYTGPGLAIHCMQVHRYEVKTIPNALPERCDPDVEVYGTEGIPFIDVVARSKQQQVEVVIKDKHLANAVLPAKFERTLDTPYGLPVDRKVMPASPSQVQNNFQPILKSYHTPSSYDGGSSCTPGDVTQNGYPEDSNNIGEIPAKIDAEKLKLPTERCALIHPPYDISLEEHRLRFNKYKKYTEIHEQPPTCIPTVPPSSATAYPMYPNYYSTPYGYQYTPNIQPPSIPTADFNGITPIAQFPQGVGASQYQNRAGFLGYDPNFQQPKY